MPAEFERMVDAIKKTLRKQNPKMKEEDITSKAYAMATASWKKSHGGKIPAREKLDDWRVLEFFVPIEEKLFDADKDEFLIRGIAINETTTLNNVKYVADELEKASSSFRNVPILLDHKNEVKNIVGRTTSNVNFNSANKRIDFEGKIMDKDIREMIKDGRISNVSIGAKVDDLVEETDGSKKAVGIKGLEISLVAVPGDNQASLAQAINHSFHLREIANRDEDVEISDEEMLEFAKKIIDEFDNIEEQIGICPECGYKGKPDKDGNCPKCGKKMKMMKEEKTKVDIHSSLEQASQINQKEEKMAEETVKEIVKPVEEKASIEELSETRKELNVVKEMIAKMQLDNAKKELKALEESNKKVDATKGIIATEKVEVENINSNDFIIESAGNGKGFSLYGDYSKNSKLKRLNRI